MPVRPEIAPVVPVALHSAQPRRAATHSGPSTFPPGRRIADFPVGVSLLQSTRRFENRRYEAGAVRTAPYPASRFVGARRNFLPLPGGRADRESGVEGKR